MKLLRDVIQGHGGGGGVTHSSIDRGRYSTVFRLHLSHVSQIFFSMLFHHLMVQNRCRGNLPRYVGGSFSRTANEEQRVRPRARARGRNREGRVRLSNALCFFHSQFK